MQERQGAKEEEITKSTLRFLMASGMKGQTRTHKRKRDKASSGWGIHPFLDIQRHA